MPETPIGSRITIKECTANPNLGLATTLVLETSRGARLKLSQSDDEGEYQVFEKFTAGEDWVPAHDEAGDPVALTLSPDFGTPLPAHLFGVGWLRFVGPSATIIAKVFG